MGKVRCRRRRLGIAACPKPLLRLQVIAVHLKSKSQDDVIAYTLPRRTAQAAFLAAQVQTILANDRQQAALLPDDNVERVEDRRCRTGGPAIR